MVAIIVKMGGHAFTRHEAAQHSGGISIQYLRQPAMQGRVSIRLLCAFWDGQRNTGFLRMLLQLPMVYNFGIGKADLASITGMQKEFIIIRSNRTFF